MNSAVVFLFGTLFVGRYRTQREGKELESFYIGEAMERDETGLSGATCWRLCDAKNSCGCAAICES